jgi:hypothetical protein
MEEASGRVILFLFLCADLANLVHLSLDLEAHGLARSVADFGSTEKKGFSAQ